MNSSQKHGILGEWASWCSAAQMWRTTRNVHRVMLLFISIIVSNALVYADVAHYTQRASVQRHMDGSGAAHKHSGVQVIFVCPPAIPLGSHRAAGALYTSPFPPCL